MSEIQQKDPDILDTEVIDRVLEGEIDLYEQIVRKYNQRLFRVGLSYLRQESDVQDAMQNTYINAFKALGRFGRHARFSTWLMRIMINECLQIIRQKRLSEPFDFANISLNLMTSSETAETGLIQKEMKELLEKSILSLPPKYRSVYMLREIEQISTLETSALLEISENNVKIRLFRAKEWLRAEIIRNMDGVEVFPFRHQRCDLLVERVMKQISEPIG